jgi:hypothetical protein
MVCDVRQEDQNACMCQVKPLLTAFAKQKLRLVWRFFGWKWVSGTMEHGPQREYWGLYILHATGEPMCLGGGTWNVKYNPTPEPLPWCVGHLPKK